MAHKLDFLKLLTLTSNDTFASLDLAEMVGGAFGFAHAIWIDKKMDSFTDHGMGHSCRVLGSALEIAEKLIVKDDRVLSKLEQALLGVACLIHDIGMQHNKYGILCLNDDFIRQRHCDLGYQILRDRLQGKNSGLPDFARQEEYDSLLEKAGYVAFSHCSKDPKAVELWKKVTEEAYNANAREGGELCRLKLLAGLLRLADELDMDQRRIPEINRLHSSNLSVESKAHWACCYYITDVKIDSGAGGKGSLRVNLQWRAPNDKIQTNKIRSLIRDKRIQHFNAEKNIVKGWLKESESSSEPIIDDIQIARDPGTGDSIQGLDQDLDDFITHSLRPYEYGQKELESISNYIELSGSEFDGVRSQADEFIRLGDGVLPAHYILKTGWHTDKYIKCRELVANNNFAMKLASGLANKFGGEFSPSRIVSIGTSAIRIGILVSIILDVPFSYAAGEIEFTLDAFPESEVYSHYEKVVIIRKTDKLLIIDDILGSGTIFEKVAKQIGGLGISDKDVTFFYLYSLGERKEFLGLFPDMKVHYLKSYPDIKYWKNDESGDCKICRGKPELKNYE